MAMGAVQAVVSERTGAADSTDGLVRCSPGTAGYRRRSGVAGQSRTPYREGCPFANPGALFAPAHQTEQGPAWTGEALALLERIPDGYCRDMTRKAATTIASQSNAARIDSQFVTGLMKIFEAGSSETSESMPWAEQARARIARAPEMVRGDLMDEDPVCGYAPAGGPLIVPIAHLAELGLHWSEAADARLARVPSFLRRLVKKRAEAYVADLGERVVTEEHLSALVAKRFGDQPPRRPFPVGEQP